MRPQSRTPGCVALDGCPASHSLGFSLRRATTVEDDLTSADRRNRRTTANGTIAPSAHDVESEQSEDRCDDDAYGYRRHSQVWAEWTERGSVQKSSVPNSPNRQAAHDPACATRMPATDRRQEAADGLLSPCAENHRVWASRVRRRVPRDRSRSPEIREVQTPRIRICDGARLLFGMKRTKAKGKLQGSSAVRPEVRRDIGTRHVRPFDPAVPAGATS